MLKKKKGQQGNAVQYVTRNQALKKLQLKLSEFRRLCILKGIHPREPKKKVQGQHKTYYHVKDVAYLLHEPLLKKVRELAAYDKKIRRATAKKNKDLAIRLASRRPGYRLDHLVRERYPAFVDALRDLDDPLTLIHLFAVLPADADHGIPSDRVHLSRRLALEWQAWVVRTHALRKAFISVKGFYFQAEVQGQAVTWLVPHQTSQVLPPDVDFKVMLTFLELHHTTMQFVLYKLYHNEGLRYPPVVDTKLEEAAAGLQAIMADLAAGGPQQPGEQGEGSKKKRRRRGGKKGNDVNPEAAARLDTLSTKVAELEAEIKAMGEEAKARKEEKEDVEGGNEEEEEIEEESEEESEEDDDDNEESEEESEEEEEDDDEEEEEEDDDDDEDEISDPDDDEIPASKTTHTTDPENATTDPPTTYTGDASKLVGGAVDVDSDDSRAVCAALFKGLVFYLGREVPREQLLLVIRAFGGDAGWAGEGSPFEESDERITHQVIDRPGIPSGSPVFESREYVQPQWVFDSANARVLVRTSLYGPGKVPPPHLSPFVDPEAEGYMPEYGKEIKALQDAARAARRKAAGLAAEGEFLGTSKDENNEQNAVEVALQDAEERYALELAKELGVDKDQTEKTKKRARTKSEEEEDGAGMEDIMMPRKVKRAYQKAKREEAAKNERVKQLEAKAAQLKKK